MWNKTWNLNSMQNIYLGPEQRHNCLLFTPVTFANFVSSVFLYVAILCGQCWCDKTCENKIWNSNSMQNICLSPEKRHNACYFMIYLLLFFCTSNNWKLWILSFALYHNIVQTMLVWQLAFSSLVLRRTYTFNQIVGCILVAAGVALAVARYLTFLLHSSTIQRPASIFSYI